MIIALNNKSNLDKYQFLDYQEKLGNIKTSSKIILCPTYLNVNLFHLTKVRLGAQNVSENDSGAYTGEISASDLKKAGVEYCLVGHSERREYQHESNEEVYKKIEKLLENDIIPILCVGETKEQRDNQQVEIIIKEELQRIMESLSEEQKNRIIIAYEPIWSIGTGVIPTLEEINQVLVFIKSLFPNTKVLYGGSANENNIDMLKESPWIDGYLVGGLSLKPDSLQTFINKLENR